MQHPAHSKQDWQSPGVIGGTRSVSLEGADMAAQFETEENLNLVIGFLDTYLK
ncbi:MAG: hypothetical protein IPO22_03915 [Anaerolineales bacterium]|nr:hypothetical protein [Anaerolineales bacterium]